MQPEPKPVGGGERLLKRSEWVSGQQLLGDKALATSPTIELAFQRIIEQFTPKHNVAFLGLCTATRPYSSTRTWKNFMAGTRGLADNIVTSNGGIIPIEFEREYPFLTYNAPSINDPEADRIYIEVMYKRLTRFFERFKYKGVVAAYLPGKRNRIAVERACHEVGLPLTMLLTNIQWLHMTQKVPSKALKKVPFYVSLGCTYSPMAFPEIKGWIREAITAIK